MSIRFSCPSCQSIYTVVSEHAGKRTECKVCGQRLEVPTPRQASTVLGEVVPVVEPLEPEPQSKSSVPIVVTCPTCGYQAEAPPNFHGREATCPRCETKFAAPSKPGDGFGFTQPSSAVVLYQPPRTEREPARRSTRDYADEDDRPRRRRRRRGRYDEDHDDGYGYRCPYCRTRARPYRRSQISGAGWAIFIVMILFCLPLFWIGLLITEEYSVCSRCGARVGW
jgi:uncharacterized paraquat-inducible protein A